MFACRNGKCGTPVESLHFGRDVAGTAAMTTYEQLNRRRAELLRAAAAHKARSLKVFGSVARGEDRPDSDIDFLVEFEPDASLLDLIGLQQDIEALLGRRADLVTPNGVSPFLRERILSEARSL
jgi:predicted nucleotidyltransferase